MSKLLYKEFLLCMQPLVLIFFLFVLMLLIPSYPYTIMGFFICNGLFYSFTQSIADNDTLFTLLLPVSKKDAVRGKLWFMLLVLLALVVLCVPLMFVNHAMFPEGNPAGVDATLSLLGGLFVLFSLFNASFLPKFYRNPTKNGRNFLISAVLCFAWIIVFDGVMIAANAAQEFVPAFSWIETHLDRYPTCVEEWLTQGIFLVVCIGIFAASSEWTFRRSVRAFDGADL